MFGFATIVLVASATLSWAAIGAFRWSWRAAGMLLRAAAAAVVLGGLAGFVAGPHALTAWSLTFSWAACACSVIALRHLRAQPQRWIHRFAIYASYGATFAAMSAVGLWLRQRHASPWLTTVILVAAWLLGSAFTFVAKTLTVRFAAKTMPEYTASLGTDPSGGYW